MSKNIIISANTSWYLYNFRLKLIEALITEGYNVYAVSPLDDYSSELTAIGCIHVPISLDSKSRNPFKDLNILRQYLRNIKRIKPFVVLNFTAKPNIYGSIAAHLLKVKCINNIAGLGLGFVKVGILSKFLTLLYRISQRQAYVVFLQNPDDLNLFLSKKLVVPERAVLLPGSGVDLNKFEFTEPSPITENNSFTFALVARMLYSKGVKILVDASIELFNTGHTNFKVLLIGDHDVNSQDSIPISVLEEWSKLPFIEYKGKSDSVEDYLKIAHCVVLPTYYREGTPKSILEALAIGRPIITTKTPGCKETVNHNYNGYLIEPKQVNDLVKYMRKMLSLDYNSIKNMGIKSRELAESKYDEKFIIDTYVANINKLHRKIGVN